MRRFVQSSATSVDKSSPVDPLQARVDAAAFALLREGRNPTVSQVRARMGGASPNAVAPALQRWRLSFASQLDGNAGSALEILPPGILELVQALWSRALFEAHRVRSDTSDAIDPLTEAIHALSRQEARLREREADLDTLIRDLEDRRERLAAAEAAAPRHRPFLYKGGSTVLSTDPAQTLAPNPQEAAIESQARKDPDQGVGSAPKRTRPGHRTEASCDETSLMRWLFGKPNSSHCTRSRHGTGQ